MSKCENVLVSENAKIFSFCLKKFNFRLGMNQRKYKKKKQHLLF